MATKTFCFKDYLTSGYSNKPLKSKSKMNKRKDRKRRGVEHGYQLSGISADGGLGEGMHNGVIPGTFTQNVLSTNPEGPGGKNSDMKKENRRSAPRKRSFAEFLQYRNRAEEEEIVDDEWEAAFADEDEPMNDFDRFERNKERGEEIDDFMSSRRREFPEEEEDDFEDDDFEDDDFEDDDFEDDDFEDDDIDEISKLTGRFVDFYRGTTETDDKYEEEQEATPSAPNQTLGMATGHAGVPKIDRARMMFQQLINSPGMTRRDMINAFIENLGVTESTAVSYYERLAKEAGLTGRDSEADGMPGSSWGQDDLGGQQMPEEPQASEMPEDELDQQPEDEKGVIRQVDNAHLVFKRQMEDGGFEELWVYNIGDKLDDALTIRRAILAGTDIPRGHTRSEDGQQAYTLTTMGNAQMLHITGLSN